MPSTRVANAVSDEQRQAPPASAGVIAPSDRRVRTEDRDRAKEGRKRGPKTAEEADVLVKSTLAQMDTLPATDIARQHEVDPRAVRTIIKAARNKLAARAEFYVDAHAAAATIAAAQGDAKPAQWAIERIAEEGERIIDPPDDVKPPAVPTFTLGFIVGGMPTPKALPEAPVDVREGVKVVDGVLVKK